MTTQIKKYQDYKPLRFTKEQIQEAKDFPISELVASYGLLNGAKKVSQGYFILNPFEDEKTASFLINTSASKNFAKAFNSSKGYDTISFAMEYENISFVDSVKKILNIPTGKYLARIQNLNTQNTAKTTTKASDLKPLTDAKKINALKYYLKKKRFVNPQLAELHGLQYLESGKYYYLGIVNDKGGFECFNNSKIPKYRKLCFGNKGMTTILANNDYFTQDFAVFESFVDYLSYLSFHKINHLKTNAIILHGVGQTKEAIQQIINYRPKKVFLALDNDKAGFEAKKEFEGIFGSKIIDLSNEYSNFKDVNELLTSKHEIVQKQKS